MSIPPTTHLTKQEALKILQEYSCIQVKTADSEEEKERLRQALLFIVGLSDSENLGICADNAGQGFEALSSYLNALGYEATFELAPLPASSDPVYLKFNTYKMSYFLDSYGGDYRGVLVACQSEDDMIAGTYGYFPLNLFYT
jgi:hypothetical protein